MSYSVCLAKENFKFSSAHFTWFSKNNAEPLHGHNYYVTVDLDFDNINTETDMAVEFSDLKKRIKSVCDSLDEKILMPKNSSLFNIKESEQYSDHFDINFENRHYRFPKNEVVLLPLNNVTSEALAKYVCEQITSLTHEAKSVKTSIRETSGQTASYTKLSK